MADQDNNLGYPEIPKAFSGLSAAEKTQLKKEMGDTWNAQLGKDTGQTWNDPNTGVPYHVMQSEGGAPFVLRKATGHPDRWHQYEMRIPGETPPPGSTGWNPFEFQGSNEFAQYQKNLQDYGLNPRTKGSLPNLNKVSLEDLKEMNKNLAERKLMDSPDAGEKQAQLRQLAVVKEKLDHARSMITSGQITQDDLSFGAQHQADWQTFINAKLTGADEARRERLLAFKGDIDAALEEGAMVPGMRAGSNIASTVAEGLGKMIPEGFWGTVLAGGANAAANIAEGWTKNKISFPDLAANLNRADNLITESAIHQMHNDTDPVTGNVPYTQEDRDLVTRYQEEMKKAPRTDGKIGIGYNDSVWGLSPNVLQISDQAKGDQTKGADEGTPRELGPEHAGVLPQGQKPLGEGPETAEISGDWWRPTIKLTGPLFGDNQPKGNEPATGDKGTEKLPTPKVTPTPPSAQPSATPGRTPEARPKEAASVTALPGKIGETVQNIRETAGRTPFAQFLNTPIPHPPGIDLGVDLMNKGLSWLFRPQPVNAPAYTVPPPGSAGGAPMPLAQPQLAADLADRVAKGQLTEEQARGIQAARTAQPAVTPAPIGQKPPAPPAPKQNQLPNDAAMGAPLGAPDNPIVHQEHVDALQAGTPFYWRDHPGAYVKV